MNSIYENYFEDVTNIVSEADLRHVHITLNQNKITKRNTLGKVVEEYYKSKTIVIHGFNGNNEVEFEINGDFTVTMKVLSTIIGGDHDK